MCAVIGGALAFDAWRQGSLLRYQLVGYAIGGALAVPMISLFAFGPRAARWWRKLSFALVPVTALLILAEVGVRVFGSARQAPALVLDDERLGHVIAPGTGGTDADGFRNAAVAAECSVLVVGDSQTWGFGVEDDETFSAQLTHDTGLSVYQMANGSYGPVQYVELVRRGLRLRPKRVVVALYFGNDLVDAADYTGLAGAEPLCPPGCKMRVRPSLADQPGTMPNWTMGAIDWVLASSRVLDAGAEVLKARLRGGVLDEQPGAVMFDHEAQATVLLPDYRLPLVDPTGERVREGLQVTARCLRAIAADVEQAGAKPVLVLIPTKELAYATWCGDALPALAALQRAEQAARREVLAGIDRDRWQVFDLLEPICAAMTAGRRIWRRGGDGHLTMTGHELVAEQLSVLAPL